MRTRPTRYIDRSDFGMSVATIRPIFADLRGLLTELAHEIAGQEGRRLPSPCTPASTSRPAPGIGVDIVTRFGYDFSRGRLDKTHHPFMIKFSLGDARITTRYLRHNLSGLFGTMHEAGHALYEQGIDPAYERTPLADGTSSAVHESQSRTWENIVGRSPRLLDRRSIRDLQAALPGLTGRRLRSTPSTARSTASRPASSASTPTR